jgi:CBS domain-containing protein
MFVHNTLTSINVRTCGPSLPLYAYRQGVSAMKVKRAMHKGAMWISPDTPLLEIAKTMKEYDIGALPIGENDRLAGMVTDRDIVCRGVASGRDLSKLKARDVMTKGISYCREEDELKEALDVMEKRKIRRLPVINANKRMVGILSLGDVSHAATQELTFEMMKAVSAHH